MRRASPAPATKAAFDGLTISPCHELHVHVRRLGVAGPLAVDQQLLDDAAQELRARLPLASADEDGAADLVENRGRALLQRPVGDIPVERFDRRQFSTTVVTQLPGVVCRRDGR